MTFFLGTQILKNAITDSVMTSGSQPTRHKIKNKILIELDKWDNIQMHEPSYISPSVHFRLGFLSYVCDASNMTMEYDSQSNGLTKPKV